MQKFAKVGLLLDGAKTVVLTNEAQPPTNLWTQTGIKFQVREGWKDDVGPRSPLAIVSTTFFASETILCEQNVFVKGRLENFDLFFSSRLLAAIESM